MKCHRSVKAPSKAGIATRLDIGGDATGMETCPFGEHAPRLNIDSTCKGEANKRPSSNIILGVYLIIFGAGKPLPWTAQTISINLPKPQALLCWSSRFPSKWLAMRRSCSPSSDVEFVSKSQC
jgi:hypothetical protein